MSYSTENLQPTESSKKELSHAHAPLWEFTGSDGIIPSLLS